MFKSKNKKILIIEDNEDMRFLLESKLKEQGFDVSVAGDGKSGLKKVLKEKPKLVLLDLMLPEMNGEQVLKEIKHKKLLKKIPVIIITNKADDATKEHCLKYLGATDYLIKSNYTITQIVNRAKKFLS